MTVMRCAAILAASLGIAIAAPAGAQNFPMDPGEFVNVTSVTIEDGHNMDYAAFLAGFWRQQEEFAKKQGWITSYEVLQNMDKRAGEPDLYLVVHSRTIPDAAEQKRRDDVFRTQFKMSDAQMEASSGERAKYRHVMGSMMLQQLVFK